jgi:hypothetical protein
MRVPKSRLIHGDCGHNFTRRCEFVPKRRHPHSVRFDGSDAMLVTLPLRKPQCLKTRMSGRSKGKSWTGQGVRILVVRRCGVRTEIL